MSKYDTTLFQYFQNLKRQIQVSPLNLGGTAVSSGGPPGGFTGYLPQNRVGYDTVEAAISGFSDPNAYNSSGVLVNANLIDNLNHIRYRLGTVEELAFTGNYISVEQDQVLVASGVTVLNFEGSVTVEETAPAEVTITITSSGSGTDEKTKVSSNDTTADYLENKLIAGNNIDISVVNDGGNEQVQISATASGIGDGDEKTKISANDTTANYLENKIVAGDNITITVLNDGSNETLEINSTASGSGFSSTNFQAVEAYNNANISINNSSLTPLTFNSEYYDTNGFHSTSVNTGRLTATISGYYMVGTVFKWDANTTGIREAYFRKNGDVYFAGSSRPAQAAGTTMVSFSETVNLDVDDYVEVEVYHSITGGGALNIVYESEYSPNFWMYYIGSNSNTFLELADTPNSYSGQAGKTVQVNSGETALEFVTASGSSGIFSGASLTKSAVQSVAQNSEIAITFNGEVYDTDNYHDNSTNPSRLTAPASGWYLVGGSVEISSLNDQNYMLVRIRKNGSGANGDGRTRLTNSSSAGGGYLAGHYSRPVNLNTGEYVEITIEHNYGSNRDVRDSSNGTSFWITRLQ